MQVIYSDKEWEGKLGPSVVTVGVFDGVHRGHSAIMQAVSALAREKRVCAVAVTFDGIPEEILHPKKAPCRIMTLEQKLDLIAAQGIELALVLRLSRQLLDLSAEEFVRDILVGKLQAVQVVVGKNFAFGKGRRGTVRTLEEMGGKFGFAVSVVPPVFVDGTMVSSTVIRNFISAGDVETANSMLGHPFVLRGQVVRGQGLGRALGYPTANLKTSERQLLPASGVYSGAVDIDGQDRVAVVSVGTRPTFGGGELCVEVYILDFSGDIYGRWIDVSFERRLREEMKFASAEELIEQIRKDLEQVTR